MSAEWRNSKLPVHRSTPLAHHSSSIAESPRLFVIDDVLHVLVAAAGEIDEQNLVLAHLRRALDRLRERVKASAEGLEDSFLYIITVKGITGARAELPADLTARLDAIRAAVKLPIAAGFGISTQAQADVISQHADGFVVGSALVKRLGAEGRLSGKLLP